MIRVAVCEEHVVDRSGRNVVETKTGDETTAVKIGESGHVESAGVDQNTATRGVQQQDVEAEDNGIDGAGSGLEGAKDGVLRDGERVVGDANDAVIDDETRDVTEAQGVHLGRGGEGVGGGDRDEEEERNEKHGGLWIGDTEIFGYDGSKIGRVGRTKSVL